MILYVPLMIPTCEVVNPSSNFSGSAPDSYGCDCIVTGLRFDGNMCAFGLFIMMRFGSTHLQAK